MATIPNPKPITKAPQAEKTYSAQFISEVSIFADPSKAWVLNAISSPYDGDVTLLDEDRHLLSITDVKALAAADVDIAKVMNDLITQLGRLFFWSRKLGVSEITPEFILKVKELEKQ